MPRRGERENLVGRRFGRLTVIGFAGTRRVGRGGLWSCRCVCGVVATVSRQSLITGSTRSCGCLRSQLRTAHNLTHGGAKHGQYHPLYIRWQGMIRRCHDPKFCKYPPYGGRGIRVCELWRNDFARFVADVGEPPSPQHTLDRIDNNGNYEPSNVRWATPKEQSANTRRAQQALRRRTA